jgi:N-acetylmuramoyl-L-alanine amidase
MRRWIVLLGLLFFVPATVVPTDAVQRSRARRASASATSAKALYDKALARERQLRGAKGSKGAPLSQLRAVIRDYEAIPRRFPRSGYSDNALWNAANIAFDAHIRFGTRDDRDTAVRLLQFLVREYPASSLTKDAHARLRRISAASPRLTKETPKATTRAAAATKPPATPPPAATELANANIAVANDDSGAPVANASRVQVTNIQRTVLPEVVRVTIELDAEVAYNEEQLRNPDRLFFDLRGTQFGPGLTEGALQFDDGDIAGEIRLGNQPGGVTRVVIDTREVARHSLFTLYNPYRLVVDLYRQPSLTRRTAAPAATPPAATPSAARASSPAPTVVPPPIVAARTPAAAPPGEAPAAGAPAAAATSTPAATMPSAAAGPNAVTLPAPPESNSGGNYSLARQLGLGVSRIVIDAGHGGHDPGSLGRGIREAELVLDVALRLEKLLKEEGNIDVVMTRRTDVFVDLEERTRIANRHNADLFLSIHANSSRRRTAQGVETFFLNFATTSDAEEVAARENSAARGSMRQLPDIVKAITLNNKVDESRDLAETVQKHIVQRLRQTYRELPDRGVKQAPLVVLIGASMPSVLAEIGFVSTPEEGQRLKTSKYRQEIAEALRDAVLRYQRSLKSVVTQAQEQ